MSSANVLFITITFIGPLVTVSSEEWLVCWVGLELRFIGFIPLLFYGQGYFAVNKEAAMKYFCVQAFGRAVLLLGGLVIYNVYHRSGIYRNYLFSLLFFCRLLVKLGAFPCHFWVLRVASGLRWLPLFLFIRWQKVGPFAIIINLLEVHDWLCPLALTLGGAGAVIGGLLGLNQTNLRVVLGASSIRHTGWGLLASVFGSFWLYFGLYCLSFGFLLLFLIFEHQKLRGLGVAALRGLPPFLLFIGKWKVLQVAIYRGCHFLFLVAPLLGAILRLFFYLKFLYSFYLRDGTQTIMGVSSYILGFGAFNFFGRYYIGFCV